MALSLAAAACTEETEPTIPTPSDQVTETAASQQPVDQLVATVNGVEIPMSRISPLHPFRLDAVPEDVLAGLIRDVIVQEIVLQAAAQEFGVIRDEALVEAEFEKLRVDIEERLGIQYETYLETQGRTDRAMHEIAFQSALRAQVMEALGSDLPTLEGEELQAQYEIQLPFLTQICMSRVMLESREGAQAVIDRLAAGEDFAAVAAETSIEPGADQSGGDLGCVPSVALQTEIAEAAMEGPIDEPIGPIETAIGFQVLLVASTFVPTLEEAVPLIEAGRFNQLSVEFGQWVQQRVGEAEVNVEPSFGTWTLLPSPGVTPPQG